jgi:signal transduction histidine kinase
LLERLGARWPLRYAIALFAAALAACIGIVVGQRTGNDVYEVLLFALVLGTAVVAGLGPGLLATVLVVLVSHLVLPARLAPAEMRILVAEGVLVSLAGGLLRSARRRASEGLAANLQLEQQIHEIGDDERRRIGHDLHDGLGQHLTGISLLSETMAQQLASGRTPDPATIETVTRLVSEAVGITRDIAKTLSPVTLERDGLIAAMEELADTSSALFGVNCVWEYDGANGEFPVDRTRSLHLFRIAQEAVNNSVRHGKARNIKITLSRAAGRDEMTVKVADDGSGLSQKTMTNPGLGLRIMQYRARMLDATLTVERASARGGTVVTCTCPIDDGSARRN